MSDAFDHMKISRLIVLPIAIDVMDLLSRVKPPADLLLCDNSVFVGVTAHIRKVVVWRYAD